MTLLQKNPHCTVELPTIVNSNDLQDSKHASMEAEQRRQKMKQRTDNRWALHYHELLDLYSHCNFHFLVAGSIVYKKAICIAIQYPHIMLCYGSSNNTLIKECCGQWGRNHLSLDLVPRLCTCVGSGNETRITSCKEELTFILGYNFTFHLATCLCCWLALLWGYYMY